MKKDILYATSCVAFISIIGGAIYEHLNVVPVWAAAPPKSLSMFQGESGLKPELFWKLIHPVNIILFFITLSLHWRTPRRKNILVVLGTYVGILIATFAWFVPELISITTTPFANSVDPSLTARAGLWETLSIIRLVVLIVLSIILLLGLTKPAKAEPI